MGKAVLLSIRPKYCELIANGEKTVEVRKTRPKLETPFKCYIYCTMPKKHFSVGGGLAFSSDDLYRSASGKIKYGDSLELMCYDGCTKDNFLNGKVIGEFVCDNITNIVPISSAKDGHKSYFGLSEYGWRSTCLTPDELIAYGGEYAQLYGWHISDLVIYDEPKELGEFVKPYDAQHCVLPTKPTCNNCDRCYIKRPPQSWCYVEDAT